MVPHFVDSMKGVVTDFVRFSTYWPLADLGGVPSACPPYGTQFFCFRIHFHRKVPMLEVHAPPPPREILYPPLLTQQEIFWFSVPISFPRTTGIELTSKNIPQLNWLIQITMIFMITF